MNKNYLTSKIIKIFLLGFSSGLPFALVTSTLSVWLTEIGISTKYIGLFSAVTIFYSVKFLWAPFIENNYVNWLPGKLGKLSYLSFAQICLIISIILLGMSDPNENIYLTVLSACLVVICSASQDIAIDKYRISSLSDTEQGIGAVAVNYGYRIGMLFTGAGALYLSQYLDWQFVYSIAACGILIGIIISLSLKPTNPINENIYLRKSNNKFELNKFLDKMIISPFKEFMEKRKWLYIILFTIFFRLGDSMADVMNQNFLINIGFSKSEIATIVKTFGLFAILFGSFLSGILIYKMGMIRSLWIVGILQMLSNLSFAALAYVGYDLNFLIGAVAIENIAYGAGTTVFVAYLSSLCTSSSFTATHYAMLSAFASIGRSVFSSFAGYIAEYSGWVNFYIITTFIAIPGLLLLYLISRQDYKKQTSI